MGPSESEKDVQDVANFKFGIYEHYKGAKYTALMIVQHHDTRRPMVVYVSHERGSINCRPLRGWHRAPTASESMCVDIDGWLDEVDVHDPLKTGERVPRFRYIGPSKS
jgi:hypothetical protein